MYTYGIRKLDFVTLIWIRTGIHLIRIKFFPVLWVIFAPLNPDPYSEFVSGYGSTDLIKSGSGFETLFCTMLTVAILVYCRQKEKKVKTELCSDFSKCLPIYILLKYPADLRKGRILWSGPKNLRSGMAESGLIWMWRETVEASATRLSTGSNTD
jgi:hypothetical protein